MIRDAEIRRSARSAGVEPRTVELDYVLGWALRGIAGHPHLARRLVFKGGTCLRKCYFPDYRFSEDLDFTATQWFGRDEFEEAAVEAFADAQKASGINFEARPPKLRVIDAEYGILAKGERHKFDVQLGEGLDYMISGLCNEDCDLVVRDPVAGGTLGEDVELDTVPVVAVTPERSGRFSVEISCPKDACQWEVETEEARTGALGENENRTVRNSVCRTETVETAFGLLPGIV